MLQHLPRGSLPPLTSLDAPSTERFGARDLLMFARRYAAAVAACVLGFLILGQIYVSLTPSTFVSATQVVIDSRRSNAVAGDVAFAQFSLDSSQIESQIQVIKSEQIAKRVVQGLDLEKDPELSQSAPSWFSSVRSWFVSPPPASPSTARTNPAVRALAERLQARRIGQSYVIEISYWSQDPETSARICNAITAAYVGDLLDGKIDAAERGNEILERRISTLRRQSEAAARVVRTGQFDTETFPSADARVITTALPPEARSWPRGSLVLAFAGLVGLFFGLLGAAIHQGVNTAFYTRNQIAQMLGLRTLGALPQIRLRGPKALASEVSRHPTSAFGTTIRQIRTSIQIRQNSAVSVCIGITSTAEGEGKTTLCANLAQALARDGGRVLLIDGDIRTGDLTRMLARSASVGLIEMISDAPATLGVIMPAAAWQADFLPAHGRTKWPETIELPAAARMDEFLALCRQRYNAVIIDLPAMEGGPDARAIAPLLDGMIFVVESGRLRADRVANAVDALRATNVDLLGAVINRTAGGSGN